jgi:hypothetical protein
MLPHFGTALGQVERPVPVQSDVSMSLIAEARLMLIPNAKSVISAGDSGALASTNSCAFSSA